MVPKDTFDEKEEKISRISYHTFIYLQFSAYYFYLYRLKD
jgi:hypothetical protein